MTPDELRKLANEATPGPWREHEERDWEEEWEWWARIGDGTQDAALVPLVAPERQEELKEYQWGPAQIAEREANARLITLAPDLARLCAELGEKCSQSIEWLEQYADGNDAPYLVTEAIGELYHALAKLSELETPQ